MHSGSITNKAVESLLCIGEFRGGELHAQSRAVSVCYVFGIQTRLPYHGGRLQTATCLGEENQQSLDGIK